MRFELAGSAVSRDPLVMPIHYNENFPVAGWMAQGYTHFEVMCIGGGGGPAGGGGNQNQQISYGGAGGGGGLQRVQGYLRDLPATVPIVVGNGGKAGTSDWGPWPPTWSQITDGQDGGYSSFNVDTCKAGGGEGGHRPKFPTTVNAYFVNYAGDGGSGGQGGTRLIGGGPVGGIGGFFTDDGNITFEGDGLPDGGTWDGDIGDGGGGGAGGAGASDHNYFKGQNGGVGSYNIGDTTVYGPGKNALTRDDMPAADSIRPGGGGGAKGAPLTGSSKVYGSGGTGVIYRGTPGIVIVRLTMI